MELLTGAEVRAIRGRLGLSRRLFSDLVGASEASVQRWESVDGVVQIDPFQLRILQLLRRQVPQSHSPGDLGERIAESTQAMGGLCGLWVLLRDVFGRNVP